jgi:outer membrane protein assembly factor BamB
MPDDPEPPPTLAATPPEAPTDPWPQSEATLLAPAEPAGLAGASVRAGWRRAPRWLIAVAAATTVLAVTMFFAVLFWPAGAGDPIDFHAFEPVGTISLGEDADGVLARLHGDRVYVGATREGGVAVAASAVPSGELRWDTPVQNLTGLDSITVVSDVVLVFGSLSGDSAPTPSVLVALDAGTGNELWRHGYGNNQDWYPTDGMLVLADRESSHLRCLEPRSKDRTCNVPLADGNTAVWRVLTDEDLAGRSRIDDVYDSPRQGDQFVLVGGDRSVQVVDAAGGGIVGQGTNVADPRDPILAYGDQLFVASLTEGRVYMYDLTDLDRPARILHTAPDSGWSPSWLVPCGEARLCLLDDGGEETMVISLDTGGGGVAWSQPAPGAGSLLPVGQWLVVGTDEPGVVAFDRDGGEVLRRPGAAVRINTANILLAAGAGSIMGDLSVAGVSFGGDGAKLTELGLATRVRADGCAWDEQYLVCPTAGGAGIWRFA